MKDKEKSILNQIVEKDGDCLTSKLCTHCPFRNKCLPEFLTKTTRPSRKERYELASDALARIGLLLDEN